MDQCRWTCAAEAMTCGTPDYISPEQARGESDADGRADFYSLGASFFHMVTGEVPFTGRTPEVVMTKHLTEGIPDARAVRPEVGAETAGVIARMMSKDPADRPQTAAELLEDLNAAMHGVSKRAMPVLKSRRAKTRRRRRF